ncbi:uncharacterized protein LOC116714835 isoform X1 [Xiphophorus hellerii]|uniref:uncharacterized protein LOC116714835 isoform X1 n=1 Tax=Xiphophorus hellerii TaxID=8084 RepID=UPI0013B43B5A|nr:uncharacterized protein LOC116714835 isoform X1 [Xiphophorus hellerii]
MAAGVGLLLLLIGVSYGNKTFCDGRHKEAQCSQPWGATVFVHLMDEASGKIKFQWTKEATTILNWRNSRLVTNTLESRSEFISNNGTFRISNLRGSDSGEYTLTFFGSDGKATGDQTLHLYIEGRSPIRVGAISALLLFSIHVVVCAIVICVQRKRQKRKGEELPADLTYVDVRVVQQRERKSVKQKVEEEVEYSQIKIAG